LDFSGAQVIPFAYAPTAAAAPSPPPPLPDTFTVRFAETYAGAFPAAPSTGAWYYNWPLRAWRAEHDAPTADNFCSCAFASGSAPPAAAGNCSLIFPPAAAPPAPEGMYVDFSSAPESCCRLCGAAEGCTTLEPGWLSASPARAYTGRVRVGARECGRWCVPGDYAAADCMTYDGASFACDYNEVFNFSSQIIVHNLTFDQATFKAGAPPSSAFAVRPECEKPCPRLFPQTCG
jgi:hypothetical protein